MVETVFGDKGKDKDHADGCPIYGTETRHGAY